MYQHLYTYFGQGKTAEWSRVVSTRLPRYIFIKGLSRPQILKPVLFISISDRYISENIGVVLKYLPREMFKTLMNSHFTIKIGKSFQKNRQTTYGIYETGDNPTKACRFKTKSRFNPSKQINITLIMFALNKLNVIILTTDPLAG